MISADELTLVQRMFLLAYDPERNRLAARDRLGLALRAAALQELLDAGFLADRAGKAVASGQRGSAPEGALQRAVYTRVAESSRERGWRSWIRNQERAAVPAVRDELARLRVVKVDEVRALLVIRYRTVSLRQPRLRTEVADAVRDALRSTVPPSRVPRPAAAALCLADAASLRTVLSARESRAARARITELADPLSPLPTALRKAVRDKQASSSGAG